jgi:hypothetical protein
MNYYLLSVTCNVATEKICREIAISISPIVDTPHLKFHYTRNQIIFSFGTETEKDDIFEYIRGVLYGLVDIFILTEIKDGFSASLPEDVEDHLFNLDDVGEDLTMKLDMDRIKKNLDFSFDEEDEDDDDDNDIMSLIKSNKVINTQNPTLDQILDKLHSEGMSSLSIQEKNILETYSKN